MRLNVKKEYEMQKGISTATEKNMKKYAENKKSHDKS